MSEKVISILPYISTSWSNIRSLYLEGSVLVFSLMDDMKVEVPNLDDGTIKAIFDMHVKVSEKRDEVFKGELSMPSDATLAGKHIGGVLGGGQFSDLENLGSMMQHNPQQSDSPDLPRDVLRKVSGIAKIMGDDEMSTVPQPVSDCNCFYCQIVRSIHMGIGDLEDEGEEVSDEELKFREWEVREVKENLYEVTNPLDPNEKYNVYLGDPLGCTCGKKNCEHIKAVLES